ncbi:MAG: response regulator transcription factor [Acidimicrobiia bacterium]
MPLRIMVVDDHELIRDGIRAQLSASPDLNVVGEAATAPGAIAEADCCLPDVIVMDIQLERGSGIEATREIVSRHPEVRVLMLTAFADDEAVFASILAGASGYVLKQIRRDELVNAIRSVARGGSMLDPAVAADVLERVRRAAAVTQDEKLARLSSQEERVLTLIAEGKTNKQIGADLDLAEKTVKNYVSAVLLKLEVSRRAEAAAYAARHTGPEGPFAFR